MSPSPSPEHGTGTRLTTPTPDLCEALSALVLRAKAVHGYSAEFMDACRDELRVTPAKLVEGPAQMAIRADTVPIGYAQVVRDAEACWLEALFVDPPAHGLGIGRRLFDWAKVAAKGLGAECLIIASDPGAVGFYEAMGAAADGTLPSGSIAGRLLPRLVYRIG